MSYFLRIIKKYDWLMLGPAIFLAGIGLISILGSAQGDFSNVIKQAVWIVLGLLILFVVSVFDYRFFRNYPFLVLALYASGLVLLFLVLLLGSSVRGAQSWLSVGPVNIAPVEMVKFGLVLLLAKYFSIRHVEIYRPRHIIVSGLYVALPSALVFVQPELGSLIVIVSIWLGMMIAAGIKKEHFMLFLLGGVLLLGVGWNVALHDYQKERIISFLNPQSDPFGGGYHALQSRIAVGSGGFLGKGIGQGTQTQFKFLPETQTDFIFASITEELGLVGGASVIVLLSVIVWRMTVLAKRAPNNFSQFAVVGFAVMVFMQAGINISMNLGIFPIAGIPLPFVSYGGSSIIMLFAMLGFLQSIYTRTS